jgi:hypothetical protein
VPRLLVGSLAALGLALGGCASAAVDELPPPAGLERSPASAVRDGHQLAVVDGRARVLELLDADTRRRVASAPAGVGPTALATDGALRVWVIDTRGHALLVYRLAPELELERRVYLPAAPSAIDFDRAHRLLRVTLPDLGEVVELPAHGRPHILRRLPLTA